MATDIIARGMAANAKKSVTELGDKVESEKWIGTKAEWEAVDKSTIKDGTIVYITDDETVILYDKVEMEKIAAQVAADRKAAETAAQTAQSIADSLPDDYVTAVGKIAENTAEIGRVKLTDKELQRRVNALYDIGQGVTHKFETDTDTAYQKAVPTGAKLMSMKSVGGRSIVWNQMIPDSIIHVTVTIDKDVTEDKWISRIEADTSNIISAHGHKVLGKCVKDASNPTANVVVRFGDNNANISNGYESEHSTEKGIYTLQSSVKNGALYYRAFAGATAGTYGFTLQLYDLTAMFGVENEPTTVEEFEAMFPADYYPYNAGEIVSAGTESVVEQGRNLWDEVWGIGSINSSSGNDEGGTASIYSKNYIPIIPNSTYIFVFAGSIEFENVKTRFYDHNKKYIGFNDNDGQTVYPNRTFITPSNAFYVRFTLPPGYGVVYKNDIALIAGSSGAYAPYHSNVYKIPEAIRNLPGYGWSAGTARNYVDYENKKYVQCVDSVDLGTLDWKINTTSAVGNHFYGPVKHLNFKYLGAFGTTVYNALCSKYITVVRSANVFVDKTLTLDGGSITVSQIQVKDTAYTDVTAFKQAMQGVMLYYELETPIITDISSLIPDDFLRNIEVEAGGSVTFKNSNDNYHIPVPSEEEYIVKLSEIGGNV